MSIEINGLTKIIENKTLLSAISCNAGDGELLAVVGPSGSGKSTLLRVIAGLESADNGTINIDGDDITHVAAHRRNIAMVFQNYALYPHLTVKNNLFFPMKMGGISKAAAENKIMEVASMLGIKELLQRMPAQLSGGQKQRVAMGRALVRDPNVFLMDEPLSNLDANLRVQIRNEIGRLQAQLGKTMLYVTHDQVEAMTLGHRIAVLNQGKLLQVNTPDGLYQAPVNSFVAGFFGNPGMNLFAVEASVQTGQLQLKLEDGQIVILPRNEQLNAADIAFCGVRPEHLAVTRDGSMPAIRGHIVGVENLGYEQLVYFTPHSHRGDQLGKTRPSVARIPHSIAVKPDDVLSLAIAAQRCLFFDQQGNTIMQREIHD